MGEWDISYQVRLLAFLCLEPQSAQFLPYLRPQYCETALLQTLVPIIKDYHHRYRQNPTAAVLQAELGRQPLRFTVEEGEQFAEVCRLIETGTFPELIYMRDSFASFVRNRELLFALASDDTIKLVDQGEWGGFLARMKRAEPQIQSLSVETNVFDLEVLAPLFDEHALLSGVSLIDKYIRGLFRKELLLFMGDKSSGKSLILVSIGGQLLRQGYKVLHITLEMSRARIMHRYFASLTEDADTLVFKDFLALERQREILFYLARLHERYYGKLALLEMPAGSTTVADVLQVTERYEPDVVIVDYLNEMRASIVYEEERHKLSDICRGLRTIAADCNVHVLTATQTNRQAAHKKVMEGKDVAEDYGLNRIADNVIGIGRGQHEMSRHEVLLYLSKARNTESGILQRYQINFPRMRLYLLQNESLEERPKDAE